MTKKKQLIILLGVLACIAVAAVFILKQKNMADPAFSPDLDPNASVQTEQQEEKPEGIRIPGYPRITIAADTADVTMNLKNPEGNPCYFTFEIALKEDDEILYTSKMVEPGKAITDVTLERALEKGEYPAVIRITTNSLEDGSVMNGANVETTLVAE